HPDISRHEKQVKVAVNLEYEDWERELRPGDELAFLPPVSGGKGEEARGCAGSCWITHEPLVVDELLQKVSRPEAGAIVLFAGVGRRYTGKRVTERLEYDAYPPMALSEMEKIAAEVRERWPTTRVAMVHRVGKVGIGEASVLVAVRAPPRAGAF